MTRLKALAPYAAALVLSLAILAWATRLWRADLSVPLAYGGDNLFTGMQVKGMLDNGWYYRNPYLGAPGGCQLYDFPMADNFHFLALKALALAGLDSFTALNVYFLLGFPLTTLSSLFVLRHFRVGAAAGLVASLLFTFLPYHLHRICHPFLASYYTVPLVVMVALWLYQGPGPLLEERTDDRPRLSLRAPRSLASLLVCLLVSSTGVYYAFFACFFFLVAGLAAWVGRRQFRPLLAAGVLMAVTTGGFLANVAPTLVFTWRHGPNPLVERYPVQSESYGLKVVQLLLPLSHHRCQFLADLRSQYDRDQPFTEAWGGSLGAAGSFGFLLLVFRFWFRRPGAKAPRLGSGLALLNASAVLLGTIGGLGGLFALLVSPSIRAYNRVSVFIAFFSLFAAALWLEKFFRRYQDSAPGRLLAAGFWTMVLLLGVLDQTTADFIFPYRAYRRAYHSDAAFVRRVEAALPCGAAIFQLPVVPFPEYGNRGHMADYDHFRGYIHSRWLRWSYGAMKGRAEGAWQADLMARPLEEVVPAVALAGFDGLWVDRRGYEDNGAAAEASLRRLLGAAPLDSGDGRLFFFDLRDYTKALERRYSPPELEWRRRAVRHPLVLFWGAGFSGPDAPWRWCCCPRAELRIANPSRRTRTVVLRMRFATAQYQPANLHIQGPLWSESLRIGPAPRAEMSRTIAVPPGEQVIRFVCDARAVRPEGDSRYLAFRVADFSAKETGCPGRPELAHDCLQVLEGKAR